MSEKKSYSIKAFSQFVGLPETTLRYYEKEGLLPPIQRNENGHRKYTEKDGEWVDFLKKMQQIAIPLVELKRYADLLNLGAHTHDQRLALLKKHQLQVDQELANLTTVNTYLVAKIAAYERHDIH